MEEEDGRRLLQWGIVLLKVRGDMRWDIIWPDFPEGDARVMPAIKHKHAYTHILKKKGKLARETWHNVSGTGCRLLMEESKIELWAPGSLYQKVRRGAKTQVDICRPVPTVKTGCCRRKQASSSSTPISSRALVGFDGSDRPCKTVGPSRPWP